MPRTRCDGGGVRTLHRGLRGGRGARRDGTTLIVRVRRPLALPPPPPAHLRRCGGPGTRRAHAAQRRRAGQGPPRLSVRRLARHGQDVDGEDPRRLPELRARADRRAVREVRLVRRDRQRDLARRHRDGRGVEQLGRRHPRPARERRLRAGVRPPQGLHPRRGPHALVAGVERVPQDARGAAAAHDLRARDDRGAEGAADRRRPLSPLRLRPADRRGPRDRDHPGRRAGGDRDRPRRGRAARPPRDRLVPRRARHARAARDLQRARGRDRGRAGRARRRRRRPAVRRARGGRRA